MRRGWALCAAGGGRVPLAVGTLDALIPSLSGGGAGALRGLSDPTTVQTDRDAAKYLQARIWWPLRRHAGRDMSGLSYERYTAVRRGLLDTLSKIRHHGLAGEQTYVTALGLCNKLNYRGAMAERILDSAIADGVVITSEMTGEVIRASAGKEGGLPLLLRGLRLVNAMESVALTPLLVHGIIAALRSWASSVVVFRSAIILCESLLPSAIPYQHLLAACARADHAQLVFNEMSARRTAPHDAAHHIGLLTSCVPDADVAAADRIFAAIPPATLQGTHYERLMAVHKAAGDPQSARDVLTHARASGFQLTEGLLLAAISAYALQGHPHAYGLYAAAPHLHDVWSLFRELLTCAAVRGDTVLAERIWETRPRVREYQKAPLAHVLLLRDAHYVAGFKMRRGAGKAARRPPSAWALMASTMSHHAVGRCSYPLAHSAASLALAHRGRFGLRAVARQVDILRGTIATEGRANRTQRSEHGDLHSVELDKLLAAAGALAGNVTFLQSRLAAPATNTTIARRFVHDALCAVGQPPAGYTERPTPRLGTPHPPAAAVTSPASDSMPPADAEGGDDFDVSLRSSGSRSSGDAATAMQAHPGMRIARPTTRGCMPLQEGAARAEGAPAGPRRTLASIIDEMMQVFTESAAADKGGASPLTAESGSSNAGVEGPLDGYLHRAWEAETATVWGVEVGAVAAVG